MQASRYGSTSWAQCAWPKAQRQGQAHQTHDLEGRRWRVRFDIQFCGVVCMACAACLSGAASQGVRTKSGPLNLEADKFYSWMLQVVRFRPRAVRGCEGMCCPSFDLTRSFERPCPLQLAEASSWQVLHPQRFALARKPARRDTDWSLARLPAGCQGLVNEAKGCAACTQASKHTCA